MKIATKPEQIDINAGVSGVFFLTGQYPKQDGRATHSLTLDLTVEVENTDALLPHNVTPMGIVHAVLATVIPTGSSGPIASGLDMGVIQGHALMQQHRDEDYIEDLNTAIAIPAATAVDVQIRMCFPLSDFRSPVAGQPEGCLYGRQLSSYQFQSPNLLVGQADLADLACNGWTVTLLAEETPAKVPFWNPPIVFVNEAIVQSRQSIDRGFVLDLIVWDNTSTLTGDEAVSISRGRTVDVNYATIENLSESTRFGHDPDYGGFGGAFNIIARSEEQPMSNVPTGDLELRRLDGAWPVGTTMSYACIPESSRDRIRFRDAAKIKGVNIETPTVTGKVDAMDFARMHPDLAPYTGLALNVDDDMIDTMRRLL